MIVIAILGLLLPGYLLGRALRAPFCWEIAFPLSAVLLAETVFIYTCVGIPLRFENVLAALVAASAAFSVVWRRRRGEAITPAVTAVSPANPLSKAFLAIVAIVVGLALLGMVVRTSLYSLSGFDTAIRWDLLPRLMLEHQGLSYYPPRTADDFTKYIYPDGFPPLVSTVYWWLYAALGKPWPPITFIPVVLQAICCFALVFRAASILFGRSGGVLAVAVLACSASFLTGVAIGQETGYTALCYAGQITFALAATRQPRAGTVVIAGLFAALGAMAREYGPLLALAGFAVLACQRETRRYLPLFCLIAAMFGGLWYARNWALTGNPLYPMSIGFGLPTNPVFTALLATYRQMLGLSHLPIEYWGGYALNLLFLAPLVLLIGVPCLFAAGRIGIALGMAVAVVFCVWVWSLPYTAGGIFYSYRVLTPAWIALSIAAGAAGRLLERPAIGWNDFLRIAGAVGLVICGGYAIVTIWSHPFDPQYLSDAVYATRIEPLDSSVDDISTAKKLAELDLPPTGVLTDSCYLALALERYTKFRPVLIWNPEASFVFDPRHSLGTVRQMMLANDIRLIVKSPMSLNNTYLEAFPLFRESENGLPVALRNPDSQTIFLVPSGNDQPPGADKTRQP